MRFPVTSGKFRGIPENFKISGYFIKINIQYQNLYNWCKNHQNILIVIYSNIKKNRREILYGAPVILTMFDAFWRMVTICEKF